LHWELLSGGRFVPATGFDGTRWRATETTCDAIGPPEQPVIRGLVFHEASQTFIAIFQYRHGDWHGFGYATSPDLLRWSAALPLFASDLAADATDGTAYAGYPSIIDRDSQDRNFATVGDAPSLIFVRFLPNGKRSIVRKLVSIPLRVDP
jgi:hypothetical protein